MKVLTSLKAGELECYRSPELVDRWVLAISGRWSQSPYYSGFVSYFVGRTNDGTWLLDRVERNAELDGLTQEDVDQGHLNDDQVQAMWGMSLEEAQSVEHRVIVAALSSATPEPSDREAAEMLYEAVKQDGVKVVEESDGGGFLCV